MTILLPCPLFWLPVKGEAYASSGGLYAQEETNPFKQPWEHVGEKKGPR